MSRCWRNLLSNTFLNASEIKESGESYLFLVSLQPLHPDVRCQSLFCISSKTGIELDIHRIFDHILMKAKTQMPVPVLSPDSDPSYNFRYDNFLSRGSRFIKEMAEIPGIYWTWLRMTIWRFP
jgi:hypothetical protein